MTLYPQIAKVKVSTSESCCRVFLGILPALFVHRAIDKWEAARRAQLYIEEMKKEQKQEADILKRRVEHGAENLFRMTPNNLINLCGLPSGQQTIELLTSLSPLWVIWVPTRIPSPFRLFVMKTRGVTHAVQFCKSRCFLTDTSDTVLHGN
jgi:hypothetical protein